MFQCAIEREIPRGAAGLAACAARTDVQGTRGRARAIMHAPIDPDGHGWFGRDASKQRGHRASATVEQEEGFQENEKAGAGARAALFYCRR